MRKYHVKNLDCANCANKIETQLKAARIVTDVYLNFSTSTLTIDTSDIDQVRKIITDIEPAVELIDMEKNEKSVSLIEDRRMFIKDAGLIMLATFLFMIGLVFRDRLHQLPYHYGEYLIFLSAYLLTGWFVVFNAMRSMIKGSVFNEHFLMTIATSGAIATHDLPEAVGVMLFYRIGLMFEDLSVRKSRRSIKALLEIKPEYANLITADCPQKVDPQTVQAGDKILVKPGEKIPLDGIILSGNSTVDTAALTGESLPRAVSPDDTVLAGMVNLNSQLTLEVIREFKDSTLAKVLHLVENASSAKAKTEKFITQFARYYTPIVVGLALGVAFIPPLIVTGAQFQTWIYRALILLVISCPCALVVSIPLSYFGGIGGASKKGILIKGSNFLDVLTEVKTVVFDKTGTLTYGEFRLKNVVAVNGYQADQLLKLAATVESSSNHPLALSICKAHPISPNQQHLSYFEELAGQGVKAGFAGKNILIGTTEFLRRKGIQMPEDQPAETAIHVAIDQLYAGHITFEDSIKEEAIQTVTQLQRIGIKQLILLSGDHYKAVENVSQKLGIPQFFANLLPQDKLNIVDKLIREEASGGKLAFVGDGINDAPVIARADVGIAMGGIGSAAAIESADVVIMADHLTKIVEAIQLSRLCRKIIWQNIIFALVVKISFIILGIAGMVTMWGAVFGDVGVTLAAVFNATRVLRD